LPAISIEKSKCGNEYSEKHTLIIIDAVTVGPGWSKVIS